MRRLLLTSLLLTACGVAEPFSLGEPLRPSTGTDAGSGAVDAGDTPDASPVDSGQPITCASLDEASCELANGCAPQRCATCDGDDYFGCANAGTVPTCPPIWCPSCEDFGEAECAASAECAWHTCVGCEGEPISGQCLGNDQLPPPCPQLACPEPLPCSRLDEATCSNRRDCHPVYDGADELTCACDSPGCCHQFTFCAEGGLANCDPSNLACRRAQPYCDGPYTVGYLGSCYEGCVRSDDCQ